MQWRENRQFLPLFAAGRSPGKFYIQHGGLKAGREIWQAANTYPEILYKHLKENMFSSRATRRPANARGSGEQKTALRGNWHKTCLTVCDWGNGASAMPD